MPMIPEPSGVNFRKALSLAFFIGVQILACKTPVFLATNIGQLVANLSIFVTHLSVLVTHFGILKAKLVLWNWTLKTPSYFGIKAFTKLNNENAKHILEFGLYEIDPRYYIDCLRNPQDEEQMALVYFSIPYTLWEKHLVNNFAKPMLYGMDNSSI